MRNYVGHGQVVHKSVGNWCKELGKWGEREKLYLFQEKGLEKLPKNLYVSEARLLFQTVLCGRIILFLTNPSDTNQNGQNYSSFFMCSTVADGHWAPLPFLVDCWHQEGEAGKTATCTKEKALSSFFLSHNCAEPKDIKQHLNKWFYYAGYKNRKGLSKHMERIKFQSLVSLRGPDSPLHMSVYRFLFYRG